MLRKSRWAKTNLSKKYWNHERSLKRKNNVTISEMKQETNKDEKEKSMLKSFIRYKLEIVPKIKTK